MVDLGKFPVLGINISVVDIDCAVQKIIVAAQAKKPFSVTALAVHGMMLGLRDFTHRRRLNGINLVLPDGLPVKWALQLIYGMHPPQRIRGSDLTFKVIEVAAKEKLPIYLYGSTKDCLDGFVKKFKTIFPELIIAGVEPSKFRRISHTEKQDIVKRINDSQARIVFVGLGCPRQEGWVYEYQSCLNKPLIAVGAAFPFHSGLLNQAPKWMQTNGLEWFYRFLQEPRRLWRRYLILNPLYMVLILWEAMKVSRIKVLVSSGKEVEELYG